MPKTGVAAVTCPSCSGPADAALRLDGAVLDAIPTVFDLDRASVEVDVLPRQRLQLAQTKAGIHGGRPHRAVLDREGLE
jgi:hypothetical protein